MTPDQLSQMALSMGGIAAFVTVLINALKLTGVIKDGTTQTWVTGANLLVLVALFVAKSFYPEIDFPAVDQVFGSLASILTFGLALAGQFLVSKGTHVALRGVPVVGTSLSK
jgi:hypothetical protein